MNLTDKFQRLPLDAIRVNREARQRKVIDTQGLRESIAARGVYNPIIIDAGGNLIAGERRLEASRELGLPDIPVRFVEDPTPLEVQIIELEENLKRQDLPWREQCSAVATIHGLYTAVEPAWTQTDTAKALGVGPSWVSTLLRISRELDSPKIAMSPTANHAYGVLARQDDRKMGDILTEVIHAGRDIAGRGAPRQPTSEGADPAPSPEGGPDRPGSGGVGPPQSILQADFTKWAPTYTGLPFNVLHCDFPYGINAGATEAGGNKVYLGYDDKPDIYWALVDALCGNLDRLMAPSAHLIFWLSFKRLWETKEAFRAQAPSLDVQEFPLIWHKSDNAGTMGNPHREPRRTYEVALLASREDRRLVRPLAASYSAPTDNRGHPSTKPEPVLMHFLGMVVDEHSRLFDPTCGGGSALRAAERLGAQEVLGIEIDPEHVDEARHALKAARTLREATRRGGT